MEIKLSSLVRGEICGTTTAKIDKMNVPDKFCMQCKKEKIISRTISASSRGLLLVGHSL